MEALLDAGFCGPPTLQNVLLSICKTDAGPVEALLDAGFRRPPALQNLLLSMEDRWRPGGGPT